MKRTYKIILVLLITILGHATSVQSQNFKDVFSTAYLTQSSQASIVNMSYDDLNKEYADMTDIYFSREIMATKKQKTNFKVLDDKKISKVKYLNVLRSSTNSAENRNTFYSKVNKTIPVLTNVSIKEVTLSKRYIMVRNDNSLHSTLEKGRSDLIWI